MRRYGLIGYPLSHSFSASYFTNKFTDSGIADCDYRNFPMDSIRGVESMLSENPDLRGFNVTIPYKEQILPYLDDMSPEARAIGAVNCVRIDEGRLTGYNTDAYGFRNSIIELIGQERPKALILGTGGASKAIKYALTQHGIEYQNVSRSRSESAVSYEDVDGKMLREYKLIINTTPLGMYPKVDTFPTLPYEAMSEGHFLFDLTYNPPVTRFMARGMEHGAKAKNGYDMLVLQAECSWSIWSARSASEAATISSIGASPLER